MFGNCASGMRRSMNRCVLLILVIVPCSAFSQDTIRISFAGVGGGSKETYIVFIGRQQYIWKIAANGGTLRRYNYITNDSLYKGYKIPIYFYKKRYFGFLGYRRVKFVSLRYQGPNVYHIIYRHWRFKARFPLMSIYTNNPYQLDVVPDDKFWFNNDIPTKQYLKPLERN